MILSRVEKMKIYRRNYYLRNYDLCIERSKQWRLDNPDREIEHRKTYYQKHKEQAANAIKTRYQYLKTKNREQLLFQAAKRRAKERNKEFNIELSDIVIPTHCPVLDIPLYKTSRKHQKDNSPTLDRFDNTKGYIKGNVNVISWKANRIKCDASSEEIRKVADWIDAQRKMG